MKNFCTFFDSNYLSRGLALYESLRDCGEGFHLFIVAFDEKCGEFLTSLSLPGVTVIPLQDFEDEALSRVKSTRSRREYCWTCTPSVILYVIEKYGVERCTYLDADLYFFDSPERILEEMKDRSIMITRHAFAEKYAANRKYGTYCVQFLAFRNDEKGMRALRWWREACLRWCHARLEDGKFGDQKYLDDWTDRFEGVHVMESPGGGIAPWNIGDYEVSERGNRYVLTGRRGGRSVNLCFYHFHDLKFYDNGTVDLGGYELPDSAKNTIYRKYIEHLREIALRIRHRDASFDPNGTKRHSWKDVGALLRQAKRRYLGNIVGIGESR